MYELYWLVCALCCIDINGSANPNGIRMHLHTANNDPFHLELFVFVSSLKLYDRHGHALVTSIRILLLFVLSANMRRRKSSMHGGNRIHFALNEIMVKCHSTLKGFLVCAIASHFLMCQIH